MKEEIFRDILGFEGLYQAGDLGRIKSSKRVETFNRVDLKNPFTRKRGERFLKAAKDKDGYLKVGLCKNGKINSLFVHRLIAQTFLSNPNNFTEINHKNGIKDDNSTDNLEWCNHAHNISHAYKTGLIDVKKIQGSNHWKSKLTESDVLEIRRLYFQKIYSQTELSKLFKVRQDNISRIVNNFLWTHI